MYELPTELCGLKIRTDYRVVLDIITALSDPDLSDEDKALVTVQILYEDWEKIEDFHKAIEQAFSFINLGVTDEKSSVKLMDWQQDFKLIIPSINRIIGTEVRSMEYLHWWTFIGAYNEIGESAFSNVVSIRSKVVKGKKLEKYEQEFYMENKSLVDIKTKYSREELEEIERLTRLVEII